MTETPRVVATPRFRKTAKRLHANQKQELDAAVRAIAANPALGELKIGDLAGIQVYKFRMLGQLTLLAYELDTATGTLILHAVGSHENFYRDPKA